MHDLSSEVYSQILGQGGLLVFASMCTFSQNVCCKTQHTQTTVGVIFCLSGNWVDNF